LHRIKNLFARIPPSAPDLSADPADSRAAQTGSATAVKMGFSYRQETVSELGEAPPALPARIISAPLTVFGRTLGMVQAAGLDPARTERDIEIVRGAAELLSRRLEAIMHPERGETPSAPEDAAPHRPQGE
jgi:hypothetical protein